MRKEISYKAKIESLEQDVKLLEQTLAVTEQCHCTDEKTHNYITGIYESNSKLVMEAKKHESEIRSL